GRGAPWTPACHVPIVMSTYYRDGTLANGDSARAIHEAFPQLSESQIELATIYARAYPRRGRPRREPFWRAREPAMTSETALDDLPATR
ncbi:MAG: hypothetical protein OXH52_16130, partial [Gammaproteobacteria bacterium]|nr:hypothetical protein [Gammaproteobacteria bacterium]